MFGKTRWRERRVRKQQDKMEWMTRDLLKAIVEE